MRRAALAAAALVALAGLARAQDGSAAPTPPVVEVRMLAEGGQYYFDPIGLHVEPGTSVRFVNVGRVRHTSTSYTPDHGFARRIPDGAASWDSGLLDDGQGFDVTLTVPGVYDYFCAPHRALGMVGRIVVGDPAAYPARPLEDLTPRAREVLPSVDAILAQDDGVLTWAEAHQAP